MNKEKISRSLKNFAHTVFLDHLPDEAYIKMKYRIMIGKQLDLRNPRTYNEKLQWLKLYDRNPKYISMVDKYEVKEYIAKTVGKQYAVPNLGIWGSFDDIDFSKLPNQFVLKPTHDSGTIVICHDKNTFDINGARNKIQKSLKHNFYWIGREWPYKGVKPRIIAEEYLTNDDGSEVKDYKFHCFNGKMKFLYITSDRFNGKGLKADYFDEEFNKLDIQWEFPNSDYNIEKPENFEVMKELAEVLSAGIPTLRVDFYEVNKKIYIGELTFYDGSGFSKMDDKIDLAIGDYITLPILEK